MIRRADDTHNAPPQHHPPFGFSLGREIPVALIIGIIIGGINWLTDNSDTAARIDERLKIIENSIRANGRIGEDIVQLREQIKATNQLLTIYIGDRAGYDLKSDRESIQ